MNFPLASYRALVGGSTQGIGRAVAEALAAAGCALTLLARDGARLRAAAAALPTPTGQRHDYLVADFEHPDQLAAAVASYLGRHPGGFQILVNNTGGPAGGALLDAPVAALQAAFSQHLICNHLLAQAVVPAMRAAGYGRIINVVSTSVKVPLAGLGVSNTVRGAVASWAKTLANELGEFGITVNNVLPGATLTQRHTSLIEKKAAKPASPPPKSRPECCARFRRAASGRPGKWPPPWSSWPRPPPATSTAPACPWTAAAPARCDAALRSRLR